jgi:predicted Kef-type K+ transport protein
MSVMFGVTLGFWVSTIHDIKNWSLPRAISVLLTLAVIICIYWWYIHLCASYPAKKNRGYFPY